MKRFYIFALVAGLVLAVGTAQALTTQVDYREGSVVYGVFLGWGTTVLDEDGTPYWDNPSMDAKWTNVGYQLTGQGNATLADPPGKPPLMPPDYLAADESGNMPVEWYFKNHSTFATLRFELANWANINEFGIYEQGKLDENGKPQNKLLIFSGGASPVVTVTTPVNWIAFGVYLKTSEGAEYYSESTLNPADDQQHQHFALFRETPGTWSNARWWIGVEDLSKEQLDHYRDPKYGSNEGFWGDYNDMIITMEAIPDASTFALFLSGLPALALLRRRRG